MFTHNVYFHKEVSYNTDRNYPEQILSDETFWIIRRPVRLFQVNSH